jgi:hypothetical protein
VAVFQSRRFDQKISHARFSLHEVQLKETATSKPFIVDETNCLPHFLRWKPSDGSTNKEATEK